MLYHNIIHLECNLDITHSQLFWLSPDNGEYESSRHPSPLMMQQHCYNEACANRTRHDADRKLLRRQQRASEQVAAKEQRSSQQPTGNRKTGVQRTGEGPGNMRDHQPDEPDHAGDGDEEGGGEAGNEESAVAKVRNPYAQTLRGLLAAKKCIQMPMTQQRVTEDNQGANNTDTDILPCRQAKAAHRPEKDRMCSPLVAGKNQIVCERREEEGDSEPRKDQSLRPVTLGTPDQEQHNRSRKHTADKGSDGKGKDTEAIADPRDDGNCAGRGAGGESKEEGIGEIVARHGLQQKADHAESRPDRDREDCSRQPQIDDNTIERCDAPFLNPSDGAAD